MSIPNIEFIYTVVKYKYMGKVSDLLNRKFLEWQSSSGKRQSIRSFAKYLNVKETSLSGWINADILPEGDNLIKLSNKFGYEIYDIMGLDRPDKRLRELQAEYDAIPEDHKDDMLEVIRRWMREQGWKNEG